MRSLEIISALFNEETGFIEVAKEIVNDDGFVEYAGQSFHPETIEWIGAVYDTRDMDEIIDLILYEPHVENIDPVTMSAIEAKTKHKDLIDKFKTEKKNIQFKRDKSLQAIRDSEVPNKFADAADENAYDVIKRLCPIDNEMFEEKKKHADRVRQRRKQSKPQMTKEQKLKRIRGDFTRGLDEPVTIPKVKVLPTIKLEKGRRVKE